MDTGSRSDRIVEDRPGATGPPVIHQADQEAAKRRASLARTTGDDPLGNLDVLYEPWSGDLDSMIQREAIRALVPLIPLALST